MLNSYDNKVVYFLQENEELPEDLKDQIQRITEYNYINKIVLLPDVHLGYYFPVGSVVSVDLSYEDACIFPCGIGFDINCGVRMCKTNLMYEQIKNRLSQIADELFDNISVGSEKEINLRLRDKERLQENFKLNNQSDFIKTFATEEKKKKENIDLKILNGILDFGLKYLKEINMIDDDLSKIDDYGNYIGNSRNISQKAKGKGLSQIGSLGSGNHYIEIQVIEDIYCEKTAKELGLQKNQILYSIHSGSRGLGHQVKSEYEEIIKFNTKEGQKYFAAMKSAANFAFANRALLCKRVRNVIKSNFTCDIELISDVSHNIIKKEIIFGKEYLLHRKGASQSYCNLRSNHLIPVGGSMGTASYLLAGTEESLDTTLGSCCHGSGRIFSRKECIENFTYDKLRTEMEGIYVRYGNKKGLIEEIPSAYKNIDDVISVCEKNKISKKIIKVRPLAVIKG